MPTLYEAVVRLADGRNLGYAEHGVHDGVPVFMFHGVPGGRFYDLDGEVLRACGIRLLTLERPGYGLSDPQPGRALADWPRDVAEIADHLGVAQFGVVGVSAGAPYALACGVALPDRCRAVALICGLVHDGAGSSLDVDTPIVADIERFAAEPDAFRAELATELEGRRVAWMHDPDAFWNAWLANWDPADQARFAAERGKWMRVLAATYGAPAQTDEWIVLVGPRGFANTEVTAAVHAWHGDQDPIVPLKWLERFIDEVPRGELTVCRGESHMIDESHHGDIAAFLLAHLGPEGA